MVVVLHLNMWVVVRLAAGVVEASWQGAVWGAVQNVATASSRV